MNSGEAARLALKPNKTLDEVAESSNNMGLMTPIFNSVLGFFTGGDDGLKDILGDW